MSRPFGAKTNMLTVQEKEKLVNFHIKNDFSFRELSIKYKISYSSARKYCINYIELGPSTLINNTGKYTKGSLGRYPIYKLCKLFKIISSSYYRWISKGSQKYKIVFDQELASLVLHVYKSEQGKYGAPRKETMDIFKVQQRLHV